MLTKGNVRDVSILRVYYPLISTLFYKSGVVYTWHEIISEYICLRFKMYSATKTFFLQKGYFGGLLSLCIGFSTISVMEIVYFATVRLYQNIFIKPKAEKKTTHKFIKNTTYKDMEIILVKEYAHHRK